MESKHKAAICITIDGCKTTFYISETLAGEILYYLENNSKAGTSAHDISLILEEFEDDELDNDQCLFYNDIDDED